MVVDERKVIVSYEKLTQLKRSVVQLTEKLIVSDKHCQQLVEKLEDRDEQIKVLQELARTNSALPWMCMSSEERTEQPNKVNLDTALKEVANLKISVAEKKNHIVSLQIQLSSFQRMAAEHKEQGRVTMEWKTKFEAAEVHIHVALNVHSIMITNVYSKNRKKSSIISREKLT